MFEFTTLFGFAINDWLISFCLAAVLLSVRIGLRIFYDNFLRARMVQTDP